MKVKKLEEKYLSNYNVIPAKFKVIERILEKLCYLYVIVKIIVLYMVLLSL